jgi:hypothetical protein
LAKWPRPAQRLETLANLARELQGQSEPLAREGTADNLEDLARWYGQVLHEGIVPVGRSTEEAELRQRIASQLEAAGASTAQLALRVREDRRPPLQSMAEAAQATCRSLRGEKAHLLRPLPQPSPSGLTLTGGRTAVPACIPASVLAALAQAGSPAASLSPGEQARRFQRNRDLIEKLVDGGVRLAQEENPLRRAACCNGLAQSVADAMRQAAGDQEGARVAELGEHLKSLLTIGVAPNLGSARALIPSGSAEEEELQKVKVQTADYMMSLEADLQAADAVKDSATRDVLLGWKDWMEKALPVRSGTKK